LIVYSPRLIRKLSNIDKIAEAAGIITKSVPSAKFIFSSPKAGQESNYLKRIREIFDSLGTGEYARFVEEIPHSEIADFFRLADVTVSIPSTDGTPMTVLESMACGTPTVIGNLPDYDKEYFENDRTTLMVDVNDSNEIAGAITRLLTDDGLTSRLTTEARRRVVETGGYEYQMGKMERIYESLVRK
jgi:glycosyltransferase involved in cell wall biosynthesis